jgi:hypothetical protein
MAATLAIGSGLEGTFTPSTGIDYSLSGQAHALDTTGDLAIDSLTQGTFSSSLGQTADPFTGMRTP